MVYALCMKRIETPTVIVTREGNIIAQPGELTDAEVAGTEVESMQQLHGRPPNNPGPMWKEGRPYEIVVEGKKQLISRSFVKNNGTDMDCALPREVLQRRKRLVADRIKQERL